MRYVIYLSLVLVVFFAAAIAIESRRGSSYTELNLLFTNPDGSLCQMPCLFGIRPYISTTQDVTRLLDTHLFAQKALKHKYSNSFGNNGFVIGGDNAAIDFGLVANSNKIGSAAYISDDPNFTLGQLLFSFGDPPSISFNEFDTPPRFDAYLMYPDKGVEVLLVYPAKDSMKPSDHLSVIYVSTPEHAPDLGSLTNCPLPYCMKWQGMKSISSYTGNFPPYP